MARSTRTRSATKTIGAIMEQNVDTKDFVEQVKLMRAAQKEFFKTHNYKAMQEAKRLEKVVDLYLCQFAKITEQRNDETTEPTLF